MTGQPITLAEATDRADEHQDESGHRTDIILGPARSWLVCEECLTATPIDYQLPGGLVDTERAEAARQLRATVA